ncbi:hypothetical protein FH972_024128 [Carpinus fangiana]|uniref:Aminoglycoside phosphotransferase domain-containing protein n=1 Tax=Carpinus fangiana TaxID=176857 RepID=A0A5N6KXH4_9ROSI|nr:hypothetical protein FH972_024128 [Carpinus fangiana]
MSQEMHTLGTLDSLPVEVILLVLRLVGLEDLRATLSISKRWFIYAAPIVCERATIRLSGPIPYQLDRTVGSRYRHITEDNLRHLIVYTPPAFLSDKDILTDPQALHHRFEWLWREIFHIFKHVAKLSISEAIPNTDFESHTTTMVPQFTTTTIPVPQMANFLRTLNGMNFLSAIHIDMCSPRLTIERCQNFDDDPNLCAILASIMTHIDHVELRMPTICPDLFSSFEGHMSSGDRDEAGPLTVIINCSISSKDPRLTHKSHSCDCGAWKRGLKTPVSVDRMLEAARLCLPCMPRVKRLRVIHHTFPGLDTVAHDLVDGHNYKVPELDWASLGEIVEEVEEDDRSLFTSAELDESTVKMSEHWIDISNLDLQNGQSVSIKQTLRKTDIGALANRALACRRKSDSTLDVATRCSINTNKLASGRYNFVLEVSFSDGVRWIARVRIINDEKEDLDAISKAMCSEVATMRLVRARTSIPVPVVHDFSGEDDAPAEIGALYVLMDFVHGNHTSGSFGRSIPGHSLVHFAYQFGTILYQLSRLRFEAMGSIVEETHPDSSSSFKVVPMTADTVPVDSVDLQSCTRPMTTSLEYFFTLRQRLNDEALRQNTQPDATLIPATRFLLQAVPSVILPQYLHGPFLLGHPDMHFNNILVDSSYNIVAILDWSDLKVVPIESFATNPEFMTYPGLSAEDNAPILRFREEVVRTVRALAEEHEDNLGKSLADLIGSPKMDLAHRLTYTYPWRVKTDAMLVLRLLYGEQAKWKDFEKLMRDSPMGAS